MSYFLISLGCPKNLVDSERFKAILDSSGQKPSESIEQADFVLINTCAFINSAKEEAIDTILQSAKAKKKSAKLIVTGCFVKRYRSELEKEIPEIDYLVDLKDFGEFSKIFSTPPTEDRSLLTPKHYAYLRISDGCDNYCSYCAIPYIRGRFTSRTIEDLVAETESLAQKGVKELIVTAQDICLYGKDIYGKVRLLDLLQELCKIKGIEWIRLLYLHPDHLEKELVDFIFAQDKICNYFEVPFQHASDKILHAMNRKRGQEELQNLFDYIRSFEQEKAIRTTFITGFPGETEQDFVILTNFIEKNRFDKMGVFAYSKEEGTAAYDLQGEISQEIAEERADTLMSNQIDISKSNLQRFVGQELEVILDEKNIARSRFDAPEIDGVVYLDDEAEVGSLQKVKIVDSFEYDLVGDLL